jgi:TolB-like protein/Flp pilus assembly protein TadD
VLLVGVLLGVGALFAWSRSGNGSAAAAGGRDAASATGPVRIAVLPFENLGDTADSYFADGVTDAVRGKLAGIDGFAVIARASSEGYRGAVKPPAQIADELGVHYLLTGTVRWVKQPDGSSRVQVSPELVEIGDGTAHTRWGEPFNAPLTDVFEMQQQIAARVSGALDVALGASDQQNLAERPTADLEAYNLYLKAEALIAATDPASLRQMASLLEQAVARDPSFGDAWARLAGVRSVMAAMLTNPPPRAAIREALDRAMALAPEAPATYRARVSYLLNVENDIPQALAAGEEAVRRHPNDANLLRVLGGIKVTGGDVEGGIPLLQRVVALDPRNGVAQRALGGAHMLAGRFQEARTSMLRALELMPGSLGPAMSVVGTWLAEGDLAGARRALNAVQPADGRAGLLAYAATYGDYYWLLDRAQQDTVMGLGLEWFDDDAGGQALVFAQILHARGDTAGARRQAAVAARELERSTATNPDPQLPALIGFAMALQGRHADARRWLARAEAAMPADADFETKAYNLELAARASMLGRDHDAALTALEGWAREMGARAPGRARVHPEYSPLHGNPRFERLAAPRRLSPP